MLLGGATQLGWGKHERAMGEPGSSQKAEPSTDGKGGQPPEGAASAGTVPLVPLF